jgi:hypothetical protein
VPRSDQPHEFRTLALLTKTRDPFEVALLVNKLRFSKAFVSPQHANRSFLKRTRRFLGNKAIRVHNSARFRRDKSLALRKEKRIKHLFRLRAGAPLHLQRFRARGLVPGRSMLPEDGARRAHRVHAVLPPPLLPPDKEVRNAEIYAFFYECLRLATTLSPTDEDGEQLHADDILHSPVLFVKLMDTHTPQTWPRRCEASASSPD